ncbi:hypothetical protein [Nevskia sp.]|uniref:hypothetical protein n=1 Tax=Nevskia sp. TaxID=1929292 RepID=UPI0025EA5EEF|nr:hypothetical protein [Nevskia sp.]
MALRFDGHIEERLLQIIGKAEPQAAAERGRVDLSRRIVDLVTALLEGELLPPTEKQLKYAVAIAQELSLVLPAEVLQYRETMKAFLDTHAEHYRRRKGYLGPDAAIRP